MAIQSNFPNLKPSLLLDFANTKQLDPRVTFTRTTTARFYDGKTVAKAEENLLLQSQDFTTTWSNASSTDTANTEAAPDGTTTADTITASVATAPSGILQTVSVGGQTSVLSVFAKKGTHRYIQLLWAGDTTSFVNFDIEPAAGAVGSVGGTATGSIVDAGNGWYRCIAVNTTTTTLTQVAVNFVTSTSAARNESATWAGTETVFLWGAQLEQRSSVSAYTATTTAPITNYIPALQTAAAGQPRFDHNPTTGESLGLLVEEQRTNLQINSEDFTSADWNKGSNTTISGNTNISPAGTLTADRFGYTSITSGVLQVSDNQTKAASSITYTGSIYVKASSGLYFHFYVDASSTTNSGRVIVDTSNWTVFSSTNAGTFTGTSGTVTAVGNGWYRITCTTTSGTETNIRFNLYWSTGNNTVTFTPVGTENVFIWGAQLEAGAFPTSYIPTTTASATRNADAASMTGTNFSSWFRADELTVYSEFKRDTTANAASGGGSSVPRIYGIGTSSAASLQLRLFSSTGAEAVGPSMYIASSWAASTYNKHSLAYKVNDGAIVRDGGTAATDTSIDPISTTLDTLSIGQNTSGTGNIGQGWIKKFAFYPARLTNAQLQALTS